MQQAPTSFDELLRAHSLRATSGRIALLRTLDGERVPRNIEYLATALGGAIDTVTVYRSIQALVDAGIVRRVHFGEDHALYELVFGRAHHHHAVCTTCGFVEDIEVPHAKHPESLALAVTRKFSHIKHYSLEFFGTCTACI